MSLLSVVGHHRPQHIWVFVDKRYRIGYRVVYVVIYRIEHFILRSLPFLLLLLQLDLKTFAIYLLFSPSK